MKKLFLGLLVAGVAIGGSAFTNAKVLLDQAYITGQPSPGVYSYDQNSGRDCDGPALPCLIKSKPSNPFVFSASGNITAADLAAKTTTLTSQTSY